MDLDEDAPRGGPEDDDEDSDDVSQCIFGYRAFTNKDAGSGDHSGNRQ